MTTSFLSYIFQSMFECGSRTPEKMEVYDREIYPGVLSSDYSTDSSIFDNCNRHHHDSPSDSSSLQDPYTMFALQQQREIFRHQMRVTKNKDADTSMVRDHFRGLFRCDAMDLTSRNKEDNSILQPELETGLLRRCDAMDLTYRNRGGEDNSVLLDGVGIDEYFLRERTRMEKNHSDRHDEDRKKSLDTITIKNVAASDSYQVIKFEKNRHDCDKKSKKNDTTDASKNVVDEEYYRYVIQRASKDIKKHFPHKLYSYQGDHPELTLRRTQSESRSQLPELVFQF